MKKTFLFLFVIFFTRSANGQFSLHPWGLWGYGKATVQSDINVFEPYGLEGFHLNITWAELEPKKNVFNWALMDSGINLLMDNELWIGLLVLVGQNCPKWIYNNVPSVTTSGHEDNGPYPYYFDEDYKAAYFNTLKQIVLHLGQYPLKTKLRIVYWQIAEGSTGDAQPYKGNPLDPKYNISTADWMEWRHQIWDSVNAYAGGTNYYKFLYNAGDNGQDLNYVQARLPGNMNKDALIGHSYTFDGELAYFSRQFSQVHDAFFRSRTRSEAQGFLDLAWWKDAPLKNSFALVCCAMAGGLDMLNIDRGWMAKNTTDPRPTDFFRKYGGWRNARYNFQGFIALRDPIDFADTVRFPENIYGAVIDPARSAEFEKKLKQINNNQKDSVTLKYWKKVQLVVDYLNPDRVNVLVDKFTSERGASYNTAGDELRNDFGVFLAKNYTKFIRQVNPNEESEGMYRVGPDTSMYGRYARRCKLSDGQGEMFFKVNDSLFNPVATSFRVQISVVYFDIGNGEWAITNGKDDTDMFKFKNTNTKQWKQVTVQFNHFQREQVANGKGDFSLKYIANDNTPFTLIEYLNLDKGCTIYEHIVSPEGEVTFCGGDSLILTAIPGMTHYEWNTGDTAGSIAVKVAGYYQVVITDSNGCTGTSSVVTTSVLPAPAPVISASGNTRDLCPGNVVTLTSSLARSYLWSNDSTKQNIKVTETGNYFVTVTDLNGCKGTSTPTLVTFLRCIEPSNPFVSNIKPDKATLNWVQAPFCVTKYQIQYRRLGSSNWITTSKFGGGTIQISSLSSNTQYEWKVQTVCKNKSPFIASDYINGPTFTTTNGIAGDGIVALQSETAATAMNIVLYPNPATRSTLLGITGKKGTVNITIADYTGKIVFKKDNVNDTQLMLSLEKFSSGIYMVTVTSNTQKKTIKLVNQKQ